MTPILTCLCNSLSIGKVLIMNRWLLRIPLMSELFFYRDKSQELSQDVVNALYFLEEFTHYSKLPRKAIERYIPSYIFDEFKHSRS